MTSNIQDYLQALTDELVSGLSVNALVVTYERKQYSQFHDHTPPFTDVEFIIDDVLVMNVRYKFVTTWSQQDSMWYDQPTVPAWNRIITWDSGGTSGEGVFIPERARAWQAAWVIYDHLRTMPDLNMISILPSDTSKFEVIGS